MWSSTNTVTADRTDTPDQSSGQVRPPHMANLRTFEHFFQAHLVGAAAVEINDGHLEITTSRDGTSEWIRRKH